MGIVINRRLAEAEDANADYLKLQNLLSAELMVFSAELDRLHAGEARVLPVPNIGVGSIQLLHTQELFRNLGIGSRLLEEVERYLLEANCRRSQIVVTLQEGQPEAGVDFLVKRGYEQTVLLKRRYTFRVASLLQDPVITRQRLPEGFELLPLLETSMEDRAKLMELAAKLAPDIAPFRAEERLHREFSSLLKVRGEIAGWIGIEQLASNLLLIRSLHIVPKFQLHVSAGALFMELDRKTGFLERFDYQQLNVAGDNRNMLLTAERRLARHAAHIKSLVRLEKEL